MANFGSLRNYFTKVQPFINSRKSIANDCNFHVICSEQNRDGGYLTTVICSVICCSQMNFCGLRVCA